MTTPLSRLIPTVAVALTLSVAPPAMAQSLANTPAPALSANDDNDENSGKRIENDALIVQWYGKSEEEWKQCWVDNADWGYFGQRGPFNADGTRRTGNGGEVNMPAIAISPNPPCPYRPVTEEDYRQALPGYQAWVGKVAGEVIGIIAAVGLIGGGLYTAWAQLTGQSLPRLNLLGLDLPELELPGLELPGQLSS